MLQNYDDIMSRIKEQPFWFDEVGVPRYCQFHPSELADIYADESALVHIRCQNCQQGFRVAMSNSPIKRVYRMSVKPISIAEEIKLQTLHYGDPPNIGCCGAGPTMNCDDIAVIQYWRRDKFEWVRDEQFEISLAGDE